MTKILVIDDDPLLSKVYKTVLEKEGFSVQVENDSLIGFDKISHELPDLVVMDIMMPKLNGFDLLDKMHLDATLKKIPVISVTNLTNPSVCEQAKAKGAAMCLQKDELVMKDLVNQVKQVLGANGQSQ